MVIRTSTEVDAPSRAHAELMETLSLPHALDGGTRAMREAGQKFLPREPAESASAYAIRLNRSVLFGAFARTLDALVGAAFRKPPSFGPKTPREIIEMAEDVDMAGRSLQAFARVVFRQGLLDGVTHVLVDFPAHDEDFANRSRSRDAELGARPYFVHVPAENLIGWRSEEVNGRRRLTQVRIREVVTAPDGPYAEKTVRRVRVLSPQGYELFEQREDGGFAKIDEGPMAAGGRELDEIPLATFSPGAPGQRGFMTARPALEDLAYLNLRHWQSSSDQANILHFTRVPVLFAKMLDDDAPLEIGPNRMIRASHENADLRYVEHQGAAIAAGRQDLEDAKAEMAAFGLSLLTARPGGMTATQRAIDSAEAMSPLASWAMLLGDCLSRAANLSARWQGLPETAEVRLAAQSGLAPSIEDAKLLLEAFEAGVIDAETAENELRRRGYISQN